MKRILFAAFAATIALGSPNIASAATELVTNGDFSTNDFTGWSPYGVQSWSGVYKGVAFFGPFVAAPGGITQTIATVAGTAYTLSFDLELLDDHGVKSHNLFDAFVNDDSVVSLTDEIAPQAFKTYTYNFVATGPTLLNFEFADDPQFWEFDNVSVKALDAMSVPEVATWAMMIVGVGLAGSAMRRKQQVLAKVRFA